MRTLLRKSCTHRFGGRANWHARRSDACRLVQALAARVHAALAQGLTASAAALHSAADAERASVLRLRGWLEALGARQHGAELDAVLTRDAMSSLQRLDEVFHAADVFVPRERIFPG